MTQTTESPAARILARAAEIKQTALALDTTRTETVPASDLNVGDVVLSVGGTEFPFPFTLSAVTVMPQYGCVTMRATHGWFTASPVALAAPVVRVLG